MTREVYYSYRAILLIALTQLASAPLWAADVATEPDAQDEYWAQFDRQDWSAAIAIAQQQVEMARRAQDPMQLVDALSLLGNAQLHSADYVAADSAFAEALQIAEQHSSSTSANLLPPLRGLGFTHAAAGRHDPAVSVLERALQISHRNLGLFDIEQEEILRQLATSLTRLGRAADADRHMNYLLRVGERNYGKNDPRMIPILTSLGDWRSDIGEFPMARQLYQMAVQIAQRRSGGNDVAAVEPLRGWARSYIQELHYSPLWVAMRRETYSPPAETGRDEPKILNPRYVNNEGERALKLALRIIDANPPPPAELLVGTLIQLGDWFQIKHQPENALPYYERAWSIGKQATETPGAAQLSFPVRVYYQTPLSSARTMTLPDEQSESRFVQTQFTVTRDGAVKDERIVEENASSRQAAEALESIGNARFRPKFVDGQPVDTPSMTFREVFKRRKRASAEDTSDES